MKKVIFIVVVSQIIVFIVYAVVNYRFYTTYCKDYYSVVINTDTESVPYIESLNIENIMEINGTPEDEWEEERENNYSFKYLQYEDGRLFCFIEKQNEEYRLVRAEITGDNYRFGKKQIGIGSDKELIEQVYKNSYFYHKYKVICRLFYNRMEGIMKYERENTIQSALDHQLCYISGRYYFFHRFVL